ncbi:MAG: AAA family ATPase [Polyangiaceae bacterium]
MERFGPLERADIVFGDLTVLVGPQASGKSLFVQLFKAIEDAGAIRAYLKSYGFDWLRGEDPIRDYCSIYFGGGLESIVGTETRLFRDGRPLSFDRIVKPGGNSSQHESVFLIPAQRVLVLQDGWPRPFLGYSAGDPYSMRRFSDALRLVIEQGFDSEETLFPQPRRLKAELRHHIDHAIYVGGKLKLETEGMRKRIMLAPSDASSLPYSAWSAGQREFTPLLLGLYWLMPSAKISTRGKLSTVVIEEPEMGLHPQAIVSFGLLVLELLHRGYRVILSTHSPLVLDLVWAIEQLKAVSTKTAVATLTEIFRIGGASPQIRQMFQSALMKSYRTYFFERQDGAVVTRDISSLDPGADDEAVSGWGGLSGLSGKIAQAVGEAISAEGRG